MSTERARLTELYNIFSTFDRLIFENFKVKTILLSLRGVMKCFVSYLMTIKCETLNYHKMTFLKSVFCMYFTRFICLAFSDNYVNE